MILLSGGIAYTIGAVLYGIGSKKPWFHSIFHIFVVIGSALQALSILLYAIWPALSCEQGLVRKCLTAQQRMQNAKFKVQNVLIPVSFWGMKCRRIRFPLPAFRRTDPSTPPRSAQDDNRNNIRLCHRQKPLCVKLVDRPPFPEVICKRKSPDFSVEACVRITYLPGQSPAKYCRRTWA